MELDVYYSTEHSIVIARPIGPVSRENVTKTIKRAMEVCKEHSCNYGLFDIRKCPVGQSMAQGFDLMQNLEKAFGVSIDFKMAVVYDPSLYPDDRARFIENVVVNRVNASYRMLKSMDEALAWLQEGREADHGN